MTLSNGFRELATVLDDIEANGLEVLDVTTTDDDGSKRLVVDLTVSVPLAGCERAAGSEPIRDDADGTTDGDAETATSDESTSDDREQVLARLPVKADAVNGATVPETADEDETEADDEDDSSTDDVVRCPMDDCDGTFESDHGMKIHRTKVHCHESRTGNDATPPYRDPVRLREVYRRCDSFTEMRDALGTDVSAQTVRRQMIAHGIYEPGDGSSGASDEDDRGAGVDESGGDDADPDADGSEERATAERTELAALELPEGVTGADLKEAVSEAKTLYDVQQRFDLERDAAMELLDSYDLLGVVHGRVSDRDRRKEVDEEEIERRIAEHAPAASVPEA